MKFCQRLCILSTIYPLPLATLSQRLNFLNTTHQCTDRTGPNSRILVTQLSSNDTLDISFWSLFHSSNNSRCTCISSSCCFNRTKISEELQTAAPHAVTRVGELLRMAGLRKWPFGEKNTKTTLNKTRKCFNFQLLRNIGTERKII